MYVLNLKPIFFISLRMAAKTFTPDEERYLDMIDNYFSAPNVRPHVESHTFLHTPRTTLLVLNHTTLQGRSTDAAARLPLVQRNLLPGGLRKAVNRIAPYNLSTVPVRETCIAHRDMPAEFSQNCRQCKGRAELNVEFDKNICNLCVEDPLDGCLICEQIRFSNENIK